MFRRSFIWLKGTLNASRQYLHSKLLQKGTGIIRPLCTTVGAVALVSGAVTASSTQKSIVEEVHTGCLFATHIRQQDRPAQMLVGTGFLCFKFGRQSPLYAVGLYVAQHPSLPIVSGPILDEAGINTASKAILASLPAKQHLHRGLRITFPSEMPASAFRDHLIMWLKPRVEQRANTPWGDITSCVNFALLFDTAARYQPGARITFLWNPGDQVTFFVNDELAGMVQSRILAEELFGLYIGDDAISQQSRASLLSWYPVLTSLNK